MHARTTRLLAIILLYYITLIQSQSDYPYPEVIKYGDPAKLKDKCCPKVIIIGAGPAGIAAASRLFQNGITNVTILEAENRIGGRVHSIKFGEYIIDMGGQWVHGHLDNVAFDLAWPLGLLEKSTDHQNFTARIYGSSGSALSTELSSEIFHYYRNITDNMEPNPPELKTGSLGEYAEIKFNEFFQSHPEISSDLHKPILEYLDLVQMGLDAGNSWHDVPYDLAGYEPNGGDQAVNWKERTYATILDILVKKYPDPKNELPVLSNTYLNNKVVKISYNQADGITKLTTADKREYAADYVIFTPSLGVLKANYKTLFDPQLPASKINSIENIDFGHVAKIYLYYEEPWWPTEDDVFVRGVYWTEADRQELEKDPNRKWMLGVTNIFPVEHKPKVLLVWLSSYVSIDMERLPEDVVRNQTVELFDRFFGHMYNLTQPTLMTRTMWNTNENFRGTYSFRNLQSKPTGASHEQLASPIMKNGKPILQFAGEATVKYWGTVHGAISSGWREADRLISLYGTSKVIPLGT